jgi:hypothetical protein
LIGKEKGYAGSIKGLIHRVLGIQPKPTTWQDIYAEYPNSEPEVTYFLVNNAPYKYYKILMSGRNIQVGAEQWKEEWNDLRERIIQNIFWFGPFTEEMITKKIFYLVGKGVHLDIYDEPYFRAIPYIQWVHFLCKWHWLLRWYN